MKQFVRALITKTFGVWIVVFLSSCYVPPVWDYSDQVYRVGSIKIGATTKDEILKKFGPPYSQDPDNRFLAIVPLSPSGPPFFIGEVDPRDWKIDFQYDEAGVVTDVSVSKVKHRLNLFGWHDHYTGPQERDFLTERHPDKSQYANVAGIYCPNADLGHADAQFYIGDIYYHGGYGQKVSPVRAWVWYSLAAQNGDGQAAEQLTRVTAELTLEQLEEAKRQLVEWKPGQCMQDLRLDQNQQEVK
jgi:hypothetical protein